MPTNLPLVDPASVARTGATVLWTGLTDGLPATNGNFTPGLKGLYARFRVVPDAPLDELPATLALDMVAENLGGEAATEVRDEIVRLGGASGPTTPNAALGTAVVSGTRLYTLSTSGIDLADLNAGAVYLYVAFRAHPETNEFSSGWTVTVTPTPPQELYAPDDVADLTTNYQVTASKPGVTAGYVVLQCQSTHFGSGAADPNWPDPVPVQWNGSLEAQALEQTDSEVFNAPPFPGGQISATIEFTGKVRVTPGVASGIPVRSIVVLTSAAPHIVAYARTGLSASVAAPDASSIELTSLTLSYEPPEPPPVVDSPADGRRELGPVAAIVPPPSVEEDPEKPGRPPTARPPIKGRSAKSDRRVAERPDAGRTPGRRGGTPAANPPATPTEHVFAPPRSPRMRMPSVPPEESRDDGIVVNQTIRVYAPTADFFARIQLPRTSAYAIREARRAIERRG